jgi:hypothetical protein
MTSRRDPGMAGWTGRPRAQDRQAPRVWWVRHRLARAEPAMVGGNACGGAAGPCAWAPAPGPSVGPVMVPAATRSVAIAHQPKVVLGVLVEVLCLDGVAGQGCLARQRQVAFVGTMGVGGNAALPWPRLAIAATGCPAPPHALASVARRDHAPPLSACNARHLPRSSAMPARPAGAHSSLSITPTRSHLHDHPCARHAFSPMRFLPCAFPQALSPRRLLQAFSLPCVRPRAP